MAIVAIVFTAAMLEIGLYILFLPAVAYRNLWTRDDYLGLRLKPGRRKIPNDVLVTLLNSSESQHFFTPTVSSQGFRSDRTYSPERSPDSLRIVCMGDSITFGWGVDDSSTYPAQLERRLQEALPSTRVEVINAGVPTHTSQQGLIKLDREIFGLNPDLILITYGCNDASTAPRLFGPLKRVLDKELLMGVPGNWKVMKHYWLAETVRHSLVYSLTSAALFVLGRTTDMGMLVATVEKSPVSAARPAEDQPVRVAPYDYERNLESMVRLCRERGIGVMLIDAWPTPKVYRRHFFSVVKTWSVPYFSQFQILEQAPGSLPFLKKDPVTAQLLDRCAARFPRSVLDQNANYYFLIDYIHPNEVGNLLVARELSRQILLTFPALKPAPGPTK